MDEPASADTTLILGFKRHSVEGRIIYACPHCQAPGVYSDHASIRAGWPKCYDPSRLQQPVGDTCPQCGECRRPDLNKGELQASIPLWIWNSINRAKWFLAKTLHAKRKLTG